jgi:pyruvate kinase
MGSMGEATKAPQVPLRAFKRTKIVATVGPSTNSYEAILQLIESGANGLRLNFSHGSKAERDHQIDWIRKASAACNKPVAIIQDLQGPKIRLGDFDGVINVSAGQSLAFAKDADYGGSGIIPLQYDLTGKVRRGERLYMYDGKVRTTVTSVKDGVLHARAENAGILIKRKGINVPDTDFDGDIITTKDKEDLAYGSTQDIDYVALSFVQTATDIHALRRRLQTLGSTAKIIAKIETKRAVDNLELIVEAADAVMVARGDMAVETSPESVPIVQRQIIELGIKYAKPTIVATQMLASMTETPEPTRAEVSDVATAVLLGADAVMLSDETASGQYPQEAVRVMKRVVNYAQTHALHPVLPILEAANVASRQKAISQAIITLAQDVGAVAVVAETKSGATALQIAAHRPNMPIIAVTSIPRVAQQLTLVYGIKSYLHPDEKLQATKLTNWLHHQKVLNKGDIVITASGKYPGVVGTTDTIKIRVL